MVIPPFRVGRLPEVVLGPGAVAEVPAIVRGLGTRVLVVTGRRALRATPQWAALQQGLARVGLEAHELTVEDEPSPALVDDAVARWRGSGIDVVIGAGGGSALDAAKAVAALLPRGGSVLDHLEGAGRGLPYAGPALPVVAVPTTAGTGAEATHNAVLSRRGEGGYKKSFRHASMMPRVAVVDPDLLATCRPETIAACGMDALTQLLEGYVSSRTFPLAGALAESGLLAVREGLLPWAEGTGDLAAARARMAYAALVSGIVLSQTGLGVVHGLASPLGALFPVPHGVVCGALLAPAVAANVAASRGAGGSAGRGSAARAVHGTGGVAGNEEAASVLLGRYARAHALLSGGPDLGPEEGPDALVSLLAGWTARLRIPRLGTYGVSTSDLSRIVADSGGGSMRTNPVPHGAEALAGVVRAAL